MKEYEDRIEFRKFSELSEDQKRIIAKSWGNPFNQRYNYEPGDIYETVNELSLKQEPTFQNISDYYDTMYFRAVFLKGSQELIGTCRYGKYHGTDDASYWDFGFDVRIKYWFKGYGAEIIKNIISIARGHEIDVKRIRGSADLENYGSYKAMIRNGFDYIDYDSDGDYEYQLDLIKPEKSEKEILDNWDRHMKRTINDLESKKVGLFKELEYINTETKIMVEKIQNGEDEDSLVEQYYEKLYVH